MGNAAVTQVWEGVCLGRGSTAFQAPNSEHVTYEFDHSVRGDILFWKGISNPVSPLGFPLEFQGKEWTVPKWRTVKEYSPSPAQLSIRLSGRFLVQCTEEGQPSWPPGHSTCVFKVCTRGRPVFESVKTRTFTHTAHVVTSGVFFALHVLSTLDGICLNPRLMLVLEGGDEVTLVEDRLGPLASPQSFYADFAVLDEGGRNLQMDLIFRSLNGSPTGPGSGSRAAGVRDWRGNGVRGGFRTLRTCLQEYTTFNNQVPLACIVLGSSDLAALLPSSSVHLQHLVLSEEPLAGATLAVPSAPGIREAAVNGGAVGAPLAVSALPASAREGLTPGALAATATAVAGVEGVVLFEGPAARAVALGAPGASKAVLTAGMAVASPSPTPLAAGTTTGNASKPWEDFWYHVQYGSELAAPRSRHEERAPLRGEFWLSKEAVEKKNVYLCCSSNLGQALTMCLIFRFSCPTDYLSLIENQASSVLRDLHIPTNGVVLGLEQDPRHQDLLRMFIEHRNEIVDDMVVCECKAVSLSRTVVFQEVYDSGTHITYRVTLLFADGSLQQASLQLDTGRIEDAKLADKSGGHYQIIEEPSLRFPISPCLSRQLLSPANRVFIYTAVACELSEESFADAEGCAEGVLRREEGGGDAGGGEEHFRTPTCTTRGDFGNMSEGTLEDWQSAGGGQSDGEGDQPAQAKGIQAGSKGPGHRSENEVPAEFQWSKPLVESVLLVGKVEEPPFKCFPMSMP